MHGLTGKTIDGYRILEQIGVGGMATVYKAYQPALDRYVAIKILPPQLASEPGFEKRFQREARAVAKLEHPHILAVHDFGQDDNLSYIVMRYVQAGTLKALMGQPLDLWRISDLISQIAEALDYAHENGIVHRDVKPSNVLLDRGEWALLTDFGLARMLEGSQQITATGVGIGTPDYMSPEQGLGERVDHRSDIYSLGVVLYEMLTGRVPYHAETPMAVVYKHIHDPLPLPSSINPEIPEDVERVVLKAMAKFPEDRYLSAGDLAKALRDAVRTAERTVKESLVLEDIEQQGKPIKKPKTKPREIKAFLLISLPIFAIAAVAITLRHIPLKIQITGGQVEVVKLSTSTIHAEANSTADITSNLTPELISTQTHVEPPQPIILTSTPISQIPTAVLTPTNSSRSTPTQMPPVAIDLTMHDDFNNPAYEGDFNRDLWMYSNLEFDQLAQQGGALVVARNKTTRNDVGLIIRNFHLIPFSKLTSSPLFMEAKLMLSPEENDGNVMLQLASDLPKGPWWTQCTISNDGDLGQATCNEHGLINYVAGGKWDAYGTWHTFRIEIDPQNMTFSYYLDGVLIGFVPIDAEIMSKARFSLAVGVHGSSVKGYIDYVRVGLINGSSTASAKPVILFDETHNQREVLSYEEAKKIDPVHPEYFYLENFINSIEPDYELRRYRSGRISKECLGDINILLLASPRWQFSEEEVDSIVEFVADGGGLLFWSEADTPVRIQNRILNEFNITLNPNIIASNENPVWGSATDLWAREITPHVVTTDISGFLINWGRSFDIEGQAIPLIRTGTYTWRDTNMNGLQDANEEIGPFTVVAAYQHLHGRVIAFADNSFFADLLFSNADLLLNTLGWLSEPSMQIE